jgi:hypothetical protein
MANFIVAVEPVNEQIEAVDSLNEGVYFEQGIRL